MHSNSIYNSQNHQPSTRKEYRSTSFVAINPKILITIDNYARYDIIFYPPKTSILPYQHHY